MNGHRNQTFEVSEFDYCIQCLLHEHIEKLVNSTAMTSIPSMEVGSPIQREQSLTHPGSISDTTQYEDIPSMGCLCHMSENHSSVEESVRRQSSYTHSNANINSILHSITNSLSLPLHFHLLLQHPHSIYHILTIFMDRTFASPRSENVMVLFFSSCLAFSFFQST
jgi:hypothetical protein